jgi:hypothetical protein
LVADQCFTDEFQSHWTLQMDIKRLVCDSHSAATELDGPPVTALDQLVMLETFHLHLNIEWLTTAGC